MDIDVLHIRIRLVAFLDVPEVTWMQWTSMSCTSGSAFWPFWTRRGHLDVLDIDVLHIRISLFTFLDVPEVTGM
jgi:hypothetical protein